MNNKLFILFIAALLISNVSFAKIWRVNNKTGITADFTTAQDAHDGASAGDTIHLEPSQNSYGSLTTSKKLVWISTGNFLDIHPGLQYSSTPGTVDGLTVQPGSENSVFSICLTKDYHGITCYASNVNFLRCSIDGSSLQLSGASNCAIINCFIGTYLNVGSSTDVLISNSMIGNYLNVTQYSTAVITNNVINYQSTTGTTIYNSILQNNIFNKNATYTFTNCNMNNNMAGNAMLPVGNGNKINIDMTTVFVNSSGSTDADFVLKAGSLAMSTGYGGIDMGAFGGTSPFMPGLQPAIPAIYQINAPGVPAGSTMNVTFSTKSNN